MLDDRHCLQVGPNSGCFLRRHFGERLHWEPEGFAIRPFCEADGLDELLLRPVAKTGFFVHRQVSSIDDDTFHIRHGIAAAKKPRRFLGLHDVHRFEAGAVAGKTIHFASSEVFAEGHLVFYGRRFDFLRWVGQWLERHPAKEF